MFIILNDSWFFYPTVHKTDKKSYLVCIFLFMIEYGNLPPILNAFETKNLRSHVFKVIEATWSAELDKPNSKSLTSVFHKFYLVPS